MEHIFILLFAILGVWLIEAYKNEIITKTANRIEELLRRTQVTVHLVVEDGKVGFAEEAEKKEEENNHVTE